MIILDTNVVSELIRPTPDAGLVSWVIQQAAMDLYLSATTEAELRYGAAILPAGRRRDNLFQAIEGVLLEDFAGRILPFDSGAAQAYALIASARRAAGRPIGHFDCQIAAIARFREAQVATRDEEGFQGCGIEVVNPWEGG